MALYLIDTNLLVRLITNDVPRLAQRAEALISPLEDTMIELPLYVLAETVYVLAYNPNYTYSRDRISKSLLTILGLPQFKIDQDLARQTLATFSHTNFDFVDCLLICQHNQSGQKVLTFDKKLQQKLDQS